VDVRRIDNRVTSPVVAKQLFDPITHEAIKAFIRDRIPMLSVADDPDKFVRRYAHNVPYFANMHRQLAEFASDMFGEKLKPSYSFLSMYQDGGTCPLHIDRPQCYRTIDYLIQQDQSEPWPICIGEPMTDEQRTELDESGKGHPETEEDIAERIAAETWTEVNLEPNDAVLYSGTHSWHYRPKILKGKADLVFFHFVAADFEGPLD
jgi:hypothetical protein